MGTDQSSMSDEHLALNGCNGLLDGYVSGTDDIPVIIASLNKGSYTVYLTNDEVNGIFSPVDSINN